MAKEEHQQKQIDFLQWNNSNLLTSQPNKYYKISGISGYLYGVLSIYYLYKHDKLVYNWHFLVKKKVTDGSLKITVSQTIFMATKIVSH